MIVETKPREVIKAIEKNHSDILDADFLDVFRVYEIARDAFCKDCKANGLEITSHNGVELELKTQVSDWK